MRKPPFGRRRWTRKKNEPKNLANSSKMPALTMGGAAVPASLVFNNDHLSPRQTRRRPAHTGRCGRERCRLRSSHSALVVRQIATTRPADKAAHPAHRARRRPYSLWLCDGGGTGSVPAAHQQRQRHRPENRVEYFERHERRCVSRRGRRQRREIALANFRRREKDCRAKHSLSPDDQKINDAVLALMALGFKQIEAHDSIRATQAMLGAQATVEQLVRACLKKGT
jgi:hypothetical protein